MCEADLNFPSKVEVIVERMCDGQTKCRIINVNVEDKKAVAWLKWVDDKLPAGNVAVTLTFPMKGCELVIDSGYTKKLENIKAFGPMIPLDRDTLQDIANCLMGGLNNCGDCASIDKLIAKGITTISAKLSDGKSVTDSANQLTLTFKCRNRPVARPPGIDGPPIPAPGKGDFSAPMPNPGHPPKGGDKKPAINPEPLTLPQPLPSGQSMSSATLPRTITLQFVNSEKK